MHPEFQLREEHFIVLELTDDCTLKCGPANPMQAPEICLPLAVYYQQSNRDISTAVYGSQLQQLLDQSSVDWSQLTLPIHTDYSVDDADDYTVGFVSDWQLLESILNHVITVELKIKKSRNHSPILLSIPPRWQRSDRERLVQLFFEKFSVPGLYLAERPLMALYGYGQHLTGTVIELNHTRIEIFPIIDTTVQNNCCQSLPISRAMLLKYLHDLLEKDPQFKREYTAPVDSSLLQYLLDNVCEVSPGPLESDKHRKDKEIQRITATYQEKQFSLGEARFKVYEALFVPRLLDLEYTRPLGEALIHAVSSCDIDRRTHLLDNIVLSGPFCKIKGLKARLEKDVKRFLPGTDFANEIQPRDIKFGRMPEYIEALKGRTQDASFLGGAVVSKLIFPDMKNYITKLDYNEYGPAVLHVNSY